MDFPKVLCIDDRPHTVGASQSDSRIVMVIASRSRRAATPQ